MKKITQKVTDYYGRRPTLIRSLFAIFVTAIISYFIFLLPFFNKLPYVYVFYILIPLTILYGMGKLLSRK